LPENITIAALIFIKFPLVAQIAPNIRPYPLFSFGNFPKPPPNIRHLYFSTVTFVENEFFRSSQKYSKISDDFVFGRGNM
jgi:hypothetical protein